MQNRQESSIVTGKVKYFSNEPISKGYRDYQNWLNSRVDLKDHDKHIFRECVIASANWLTSKGILTKIGGLTNGIYPEDYDLCFRLYANNVPVLSLPEVTHFWREHKERTSRTSSDYNQESFFKLKLHYINNLFQGKSIAYFGAGTKMKLFKKYVDVHVTYYQLENNENDTKKHYTEVDEDILFLGMYPSVQRRIELEDFLAKRGFVIGENTFYL